MNSTKSAFPRSARLALWLCLFASFALVSAAQVYTFNAATFGTGNNPSAAATGDFNGDGRLDVAVVNYNDNTVSVLLGNADGSYEPHVDYQVGTGPVGVVVADFNSDSKLDLAVVNANCPTAPCTKLGTISVLLGNGDGTFQTAIPHNVGKGPTSIAAGDLDRNGKMDLVVANGQDNNVTLLLGNNNGTFTTLRSLAVGTNPKSVAIDDFNGDLKPDIVVANQGDGGIGLLKGNGNGTFNNQLVFATGPSPVALAIGDFNEDGKPDVVTSNSGNATISLLINNQFFGTPGFLKHVDLSATAKGSGVITGDFNGDGHDDIAAIAAGTDSVSVLTGKGDGTMNFRVDFGTGSDPVAVVAGDFTGDGRTDIGVVNNIDNSVNILPSLGLEIFQHRLTTATGNLPTSVAAADFNGDQKLDLAVVNHSDNSVLILTGNGDGSFSAQPSRPQTGNKPTAIVAVDLNKDTKLDLVVTNAVDNTISVFKGHGDGNFSSALTYTVGKKPVALAAADVNNDSNMDVIVVDQNDNNCAFLAGNGDGTLKGAKFFSVGPASGPVAIALGDFGNGKVDVAVANSATGGVAVLLGNGNGGFSTPTLNLTGSSPSAVAIGDFNGDGKNDLAVTNNKSNNVSILLGNGDGTFQGHVDYPTAKSPWSVTTGHFNADGNLDLAVGAATAGTNRVSILVGDGHGAFLPRTDHATTFLSGGSGEAIAVGDFNGDGVDDVVAADQLANKVSAFLNLAVPVAYPGLINFGNQNLGNPSTPVTVTLTNSGGAPLGNLAVNTMGSDYSQGSACGLTLAPADNCTTQVTFTPSDVGTRLGALQFTDDAPSTPQNVALLGTGNGSGAALSVTSLSFPITQVGTSSIKQNVTLTNYGNQTLNVSSVTVSGNFVQTNTCTPTVPAGKTCNISVAFKPKSGGPLTGSVTITDDAFNSPQVISLSGTGTIVKLSPTALTFAPQNVGTSSQPQPVTLSNVGTVTLNISSITIVGANSGDFGEQDNCQPGVNKQGSCTISVTFTPTGVGTRTASISITDDGGGSPQLIPLTGTGQ